MSEDCRKLVEPRNVTMYPIQWATVDAYAKDGGYSSTSAALRRIVDEWKNQRRLDTLLRAYVAGLINAQEVVDELLSRPSLLAVSDREGS